MLINNVSLTDADVSLVPGPIIPAACMVSVHVAADTRSIHSTLYKEAAKIKRGK